MTPGSLRHRLVAALAAAAVGAFAGAGAVLVAYHASAGIAFEMDRDLPRSATGFFTVERGGGKTFAWTGRTAAIAVPELRRAIPWTCTVELLGWRPPGVPLPAVQFFVDGVARASVQMKGADETVRVDAPVRPDGGSGFALTLAVSETFRPATDPRDLGVAVDRIDCRPQQGRLALAPLPALVRAAGAAAVFGAVFGAIGLAAPLAAAGAVLAAIGQAWPLTSGMAPYLPGQPPALPLALGLGLFAFVLVGALDAFRRGPLSRGTRIAVGASALICFVKLLVLLHPNMPTMDALMQAHRLEWVLAGRYYFTSLTPSGYLFPYGISLYLAAAPFASLVGDHVVLLRLVVCAAEMLAGLCLYAIVASAWRDRAAAFVALVLFHTTPIAAAVVGTGNLTNAFGESIALMAVAIIVALPLAWPAWAWLVVPVLTASFAFIAHFSTFVVLAIVIGATGVVYYLAGGPTLRRAAVLVLAGLGLAVALSVLLFYGHFWSTYREQAARFAGEVSTRAPAGMAQDQPAARPAPAGRARPPLSDRVATLGRRTRSAYEWLLPVMALVGLARLVRRRSRDRLSLAIAGWLLTLALCSALAVLTPLELRYHLAVAPALTVLAGLAVAAGWRAGGWQRWLIMLAAIAAFLLGWRGWFDWML